MLVPLVSVDYLTSVINALIVVIAIIVYRRWRQGNVEIRGRTVLITGGASGVGLATAKRFAATGMNVIVWDKNETRMKSTRVEIRKQLQLGFTLIQQCVDISNPLMIKSAFLDLRRKLNEKGINSVSIIVNNAGIVYDHTIENMDINEVENTFSVNVISQFSILHTFMPDLVQQKVSNIVNVSSLISAIPASHLSSYSASKAAIKAMSDCFRIELKSTNNDHIHVTTVSPQFISTGMFEGANSNSYLWHRLRDSFFPKNSPEQIAKEIEYAIVHEKDDIVLPRIIGWVLPFLYFLPHVVSDYFYMHLGGSHGMEGFKGRGMEWNRSHRMEQLEKQRNENKVEYTIVSCDTRQ